MAVLRKLTLYFAIVALVRIALAAVEIWLGVDTGRQLVLMFAVWEQPGDKWIAAANWGIALLVVLLPMLFLLLRKQRQVHNTATPLSGNRRLRGSFRVEIEVDSEVTKH